MVCEDVQTDSARDDQPHRMCFNLPRQEQIQPAVEDQERQRCGCGEVILHLAQIAPGHADEGTFVGQDLHQTCDSTAQGNSNKMSGAARDQNDQLRHKHTL